MEEYKKDDRGRSKAKRLTMNDPHTKVDSSTWTPDAAENAGVKTGARPLVKRLYKKGGKVVGKHEGKDSVKHAGRMPRKAGGRTDKLTPDSLINRDVRTANEVREGKKHDGAFKKGGVAKYGKGGRMPLEGHPYHKKTDAELRYISKDAAEAARSMKGMDSKAENKYLDQMNDAQTVLGHRQRTGNGPESGMKKGGRTHKLGGGMVGDNPLSVQDRSMAKASGMMKKGGRAKKRADGGDAIADMIRQDQIEQGMKGRGLPERVPMPPRRPADKPMTPRDPIPTSTNFGAKKGGKIKHPDEKADRQLIKSMIKPTAFKAKGGKVMHHDDCTCKMCGGGRTMKYGGGGVFSGNSKEKIPGATGGRTAHAKGGKAGKTTINIVMGGHGQQPQNYPNAPVMPPRPPAGVPVPPPATAGGAPMMPPQGMPPQMPPQGGDMPMPRKSGGRIGKLGGGSLGSQMGSAGNGMGRGAMLGAGAGGMPNTNGPRGGNPTPPLFGGGNVQPTGPMTGMGYAKMMQTMNGQGVPFPSAQGGQNVPPPPPPFFGQGGQGGNPPPVQGYAAPPNMMPRKSGGRTNYPIDTGAGGANARLEKIDAYGLKPSKRK